MGNPRGVDFWMSSQIDKKLRAFPWLSIYEIRNTVYAKHPIARPQLTVFVIQYALNSILKLAAGVGSRPPGIIIRRALAATRARLVALQNPTVVILYHTIFYDTMQYPRASYGILRYPAVTRTDMIHMVELLGSPGSTL